MVVRHPHPQFLPNAAIMKPRSEQPAIYFFVDRPADAKGNGRSRKFEHVDFSVLPGFRESGYLNAEDIAMRSATDEGIDRWICAQKRPFFRDYSTSKG